MASIVALRMIKALVRLGWSVDRARFALSAQVLVTYLK